MTKTAFDFSGMVVAISGASGGFGNAMAEKFSNAGAKLVLLDRTLASLTLISGRTGAICFEYDQSDFASVEAVAAAMPVPDIFINNAGTTVRKPFFEMSTSEMLGVININLTGAVLLATRLAARMAQAGGGTIVNMTSQLAFSGGENRGIYSMTKAGMVQFTKSAAVEWARYGIRVCALAPGAADTPMTADLQRDKAAMDRLGLRVPSGRMIPAAEIADIALFLASDAARSVVGQTVIADDGYLLT